MPSQVIDKPESPRSATLDNLPTADFALVANTAIRRLVSDEPEQWLDTHRQTAGE